MPHNEKLMRAVFNSVKKTLADKSQEFEKATFNDEQRDELIALKNDLISVCGMEGTFLKYKIESCHTALCLTCELQVIPFRVKLVDNRLQSHDDYCPNCDTKFPTLEVEYKHSELVSVRRWFDDEITIPKYLWEQMTDDEKTEYAWDNAQYNIVDEETVDTIDSETESLIVCED